MTCLDSYSKEKGFPPPFKKLYPKKAERSDIPMMYSLGIKEYDYPIVS
jgi:hypothetical protein